MNAKSLIRLTPIVLACQLFAGAALAQQPSAAAVALGRDLVEAKGANQMFEPIVLGVVEHGLFIGMAQAAILAGPAGARVVERP